MTGISFLHPFEGLKEARVQVPAGEDTIILMEKQLPFKIKHVTNV